MSEVMYNAGIRIVGYSEEIADIGEALNKLSRYSRTADELIWNLGFKFKKILTIGKRLDIRMLCNCMSCTHYGKYSIGRNFYNTCAHIINYSPEQFIYDRSESWMHAPPEIWLVHELVHAYHSQVGIFRIDSYYQEEHSTVGLNEYKDDKFTENAVRRDYGLPERTKY